MRQAFFIFAVCALAHPATAEQTASWERWRGELICGHEQGRFSSGRTIEIADGDLRFADDDESERWDGFVDADGVAYVVGAYTWRTQKPLHLVGRKIDGALTLEGWRGPKRCRFEARRIAP